VGEVITGIIEKYNTIEAKKFFRRYKRSEAFAIFIIEFSFSLPPMLLLVGVALAD